MLLTRNIVCEGVALQPFSLQYIISNIIVFQHIYYCVVFFYSLILLNMKYLTFNIVNKLLTIFLYNVFNNKHFHTIFVFENLFVACL